MDKRKKIIVTIVIAVVLMLAVTIAGVAVSNTIENTVKSGTVKIDDINLQVIHENGVSDNKIVGWQPSDIDQITWNVKNVGTSAVYTRNKIQVYFNDEIPENSQIIYLYPANMTRAQIIEDFEKGENSEYAIKKQIEDIKIDENTTKKGFEYEILGDVLDGTKMTGKSSEVDYNSKDFSATTDDSSKTEDVVAFKILFSPKASYLFQGKELSIKVVTEAMQCTDEGKAEWKIVGSQTIGG